MLELLSQTLKGVRKPFLLVDQISEVREQVLVRLPDSCATAGRVFNRVLKLLTEVRNGGGLLLELHLAGKHLGIEDDGAAAELCASWYLASKQTNQRDHYRE